MTSGIKQKYKITNMVYSLKINHFPASQLRILLIVVMLVPIFAVNGEPDGSTNTEILNYQDSQTIVGSAAQVLLKQKTSNTLLAYCADKFKHLSQSAQTASQDWQNKHARIITKANDINHYVARTIAMHDSIFAAEKFSLKFLSIRRVKWKQKQPKK